MCLFLLPSVFFFFGRETANIAREKIGNFGRENQKCPRKNLKTVQKVPEKEVFSPRRFSENYTRESKNFAREKNEKMCPRRPQSAREKYGSIFLCRDILHKIRNLGTGYSHLYYSFQLIKTNIVPIMSSVHRQLFF